LINRPRAAGQNPAALGIKREKRKKRGISNASIRKSGGSGFF
jgi:hypothetical protein